MSLLGRQSPDERDERLGGSRMATGPSRKEENIYIPQFITKRPFWAIDESEEDAVAAAATTSIIKRKEADAKAGGDDTATNEDDSGGHRPGARDYLEHQRMRKRPEEDKWLRREGRTGPVATKYRKGACENCGAMGHKIRDCLSRPRAKLAKHTGRDIQPDEQAHATSLSWDAKRDNWKSFDPRDFAFMMAQRQRKLAAVLGAEAKEAEEKEAEEKKERGLLSSSVNPDDTRYAEDADMGVSRTNGAADLRMREDTARYLVNLDLDSAQYDPKRRKIVDGGAFHDESARLFAEQNFARASGDAADFASAERYAWEMHDRTGDASMHLQANPTAAAHQRRLEQEAALKKRQEMARLMQEKYGVDISADPDLAGVLDEGGADSNSSQQKKEPKAQNKAAALTALAASEHFVEYDESGHVKDRYQGRRHEKSKYAEDIFPGNHTSVWGSWWHNFQWGYSCCHSIVRNSYCTGSEGIAAFERAERQRLGVWDGDDGGGGALKMITDGEDDDSRASPPREDGRRESRRGTPRR